MFIPACGAHRWTAVSSTSRQQDSIWVQTRLSVALWCPINCHLYPPCCAGERATVRKWCEGAPFATIHCNSTPEDRLKSELAGREKGVFTGAPCRRKLHQIQPLRGEPPGLSILDVSLNNVLESSGIGSPSFGICCHKVQRFRSYQARSRASPLQSMLRSQ